MFKYLYILIIRAEFIAILKIKLPFKINGLHLITHKQHFGLILALKSQHN